MSVSVEATREAAFDFGALIITTSLSSFPARGCFTSSTTAEWGAPESNEFAFASSIPRIFTPSMAQIISPIATRLLAAAMAGSMPVTTCWPDSFSKVRVIPMLTFAPSPESLLNDERLFRLFLLFRAALFAPFCSDICQASAGIKNACPGSSFCATSAPSRDWGEFLLEEENITSSCSALGDTA
jgi:hypothetical protein